MDPRNTISVAKERKQSSSLWDEADRKKALVRFTDSADSLLADCGFGGVYAADPYDAFLILCMLTNDPFAAYSDVMEFAYADADRQETERES